MKLLPILCSPKVSPWKIELLEITNMMSPSFLPKPKRARARRSSSSPESSLLVNDEVSDVLENGSYYLPRVSSTHWTSTDKGVYKKWFNVDSSNYKVPKHKAVVGSPVDQSKGGTCMLFGVDLVKTLPPVAAPGCFI